MEIFRTIWQCLTTPNELVFKYISIPLAFLETYITMVFFMTILDIKSTTNKKIIYVIIMSLTAIISKTIFTNVFATFFNMLLWPVFVILIFKTSILIGILSEILTFCLTACIDTISSIIFMSFQIDYSSIIKIPIYRLLIMLSTYLIIFLLSLFLKHKKFNIRIFDNLSKKTKLLLIGNTILVILIIASQIYLITLYNENVPFNITIISMIGLMSYFILSIYTIINVSKLEKTSRDLEEAQLYNKTLNILHDSLRAFKHDFHNIVHAIGGYANREDSEGLKKYYSQLLEDCTRVNNLTALSPDAINNPAIYNILATKYYKADELGIKINLEVFLDLNEIDQNMKIYEFTRILGILMDNAIEASKECDEKIINLIIRKEDSRHRLLLIIENTYCNKNINTEQIYEKGYSTKEGNSGLGLWEVRQILKRNNNLNLFTSKTPELFKQQFEIYY